MPAVNASEKAKKAELGTRVASRLSLSLRTKKDATLFFAVGLEAAPKVIFICFYPNFKPNIIHANFPSSYELDQFYLYNDTAIFFFLVL